MPSKVSADTAMRAEKPWAGQGAGNYDDHSRTFYLTAAAEYEVCSRCTRPKCLSTCNPLAPKSRSEKVDRIEALARSGMYDNEIATVLGIKQSKVGEIRRRYSIPAGRFAATKKVRSAENDTCPA